MTASGKLGTLFGRQLLADSSRSANWCIRLEAALASASLVATPGVILTLVVPTSRAELFPKLPFQPSPAGHAPE